LNHESVDIKSIPDTHLQDHCMGVDLGEGQGLELSEGEGGPDQQALDVGLQVGRRQWQEQKIR
jgi:hypothetical protein